MADQVLDRSMLDGKDREQLHAIAGAMGIKGVTRLRKADLVGAILDAATSGATAGGATGNGDAAKSSNGSATGAATSKAAKATRPSKSTKPKATAPSADGSASDSATASASAPARRAVRSKRASELAADDGGLAALAAEEDGLASGDGAEGAPGPVRRTRPVKSTAGGAALATTAGESGAQAAEGSAAAAPTDVASSTGAAGGQPRGRTEGRSEGRSTGPATSSPDSDDEQASFGEGNRPGRRRRRRGRDRGGEPRGNEPRSDNRGNENRGNENRGPNRGNENRGNERGDRSGETDRDDLAEAIDVEGLLDLRDEGYGFLRTKSYLAGRNDVYVSASQVRRFALRKGDFVKGQTRPPASNEKYPALLRVDEINGLHPDAARERIRFEDLTALFPDERLRLEILDDPALLTGRIVDLLAPIGKGQRGMIVSPPKAGKTTIMKQIVGAIERNNPEVHLMVLLVGERPEEVTDMKRHVQRGEVIASTFDRPSDEHTHVSELTIERAKRLVEMGKDVVILLDGITRLARAYNLSAPATGRIMTGGIDAGALYPPKRFFGSARNVEEGGSLTIIATALVETNSKMDEHIFEEFKGTGNWELKLDRKLAERRLFPAIDVNASSTRHEELLFDRHQLSQVWKLRRVLSALAQEGSSAPGLELLIDKLKTTKSNDEFLDEIAKAPSGG